jgi:hypothetical protein
MAEINISTGPELAFAELTIGPTRPRIPRVFSRDFVALAHDLLALGDVCAVGLSGCLSALLWMRLSIPSILPGQLWSTFGSRAAVAAVIAPFVLRAVRPETCVTTAIIGGTPTNCPGNFWCLQWSWSSSAT